MPAQPELRTGPVGLTISMELQCIPGFRLKELSEESSHAPVTTCCIALERSGQLELLGGNTIPFSSLKSPPSMPYHRSPCILVAGPPGVGKSSLIECVCLLFLAIREDSYSQSQTLISCLAGYLKVNCSLECQLKSFQLTFAHKRGRKPKLQKYEHHRCFEQSK